MNELQVSRVHSLSSDTLEKSIDQSPTSCLPPLCKTMAKTEEGKNKNNFIISLSLIPTAANCDLKLFSLLLEFKVLDSYRI